MAQSLHSRGLVTPVALLILLPLSVLALYEMRLGPASEAVSASMESVVTKGVIPERNFHLKSSFTGIVPVDTGLRVLVGAFLPGVAGWDRGLQVQQLYLLLSFFSIVTVWSIDAVRVRNWSKDCTALVSLYDLRPPLPRPHD